MSLLKKKKKTETVPYYRDLADAAFHLGLSPDTIRKGHPDLPVVTLTESERPKLAVRSIDVERFKAKKDREAGILD